MPLLCTSSEYEECHGRGVDTEDPVHRVHLVRVLLGERDPRLECDGIVDWFNWRSHGRSGAVNRAGI